MANQAKWERVGTSKRYLHPPMSGFLCTQWPDFKVIMGRFETQCATVTNYSAYPAAGFRVLWGEDLESVDFKNTRLFTRDDGAVIHRMENKLPTFSLHMESFCNTGTQYPSIFTRLTVTNEGTAPISDILGILLRSGAENLLTGAQVDAYITFDGNVANWGFIPATWQWDGRTGLQDSNLGYAVEIEENEGFDLSWHGAVKGCVWHKRHLLKAAFALRPGESKSIVLRMYSRRQIEQTEAYDVEREKAIAFWQKELGRIQNMPGKPEHAPMVRNLTAQLLQMFSTYLDEGFIAPRQGGMSRFFWSVEAMDFLMPLARMGDFTDYTRTAYDFFFDHCQVSGGDDDGEVILHTAWGSTTGGAIRACAYHLLYTNEEEYRRYREPLYRAFQWVQRQRAKSYEQDCLYKGIFPARRGTDWPGEFQSWCMTDCHTLLAFRELADAFEKYHDPCTAEVRAAYEDYKSCLTSIYWDEVAKYDGDPEELLLPNRLGIPQTDPPMGAYQGDGPAMLLLAGIMDPNSEETQRVENFFRNRCCHQNGLTGLMCDGRLRPNKDTDSTAGHMWYLGTCDLRWFYTWLVQGRRDKAEEVIKAQMAYGMSDTYSFVERFADNDPWYMPWQPNASNNGRLLSMLMDFYNE